MRALPLAALLLVGGLPIALQGQPEARDPARRALVGYDFDGPQVETGPYTVMVFQDSRGSVRLSTAYRHSGERSVEIRDVPGDGDFAELQGFFPQLDQGTLAFHFALMTAEPEESLNVALAGEAHFVLERDGIGFWLETRDGELLHHTNGHAVPLLRVLPFVWYEVAVVYRIDRGDYDLRILQEGRLDPVVDLRDQPNAVGLPGSRVFKFSFIGDPPGKDDSSVRFYVDDIFIGTDQPVEQAPFVAPGRRMLFIDLWNHYRLRSVAAPGCLSAIEPQDFGFADSDLIALLESGAMEAYATLAEPGVAWTPRYAEAPDTAVSSRLLGMELWNRGCRSPTSCREAPCAVDLFEAARVQVPTAKLYPMSKVLALATQGRWDEADELWVSIYSDWEHDPRFPAISAQLGFLAGDLEWVTEALDAVPDDGPADGEHPLVRRLWSGKLSHELALELAAAFPDRWRQMVRDALLAEHRYYVLLWQGALAAARDYASLSADRSRRLGISPSRWLERRADALFWAGDQAAALADYERSLEGHPNPRSVVLKLSDVYYQLGDLERERSYREAIYGTLREE